MESFAHIRRSFKTHIYTIALEIIEQIVVTDPHGFHMRRCKDLVEVARKYVTHRIFIRARSQGGNTWANARSILSLQALRIRGPQKGEPPPVVEVKVIGLRPSAVLREIHRVLSDEPNKYLSVYELYELTQKNGGELAVRAPAASEITLGQRVARVTDRMGTWVGSWFNSTSEGAAEGSRCEAKPEGPLSAEPAKDQPASHKEGGAEPPPAS